LGTSITPIRCAKRIEAHTPPAETAMEAAASPRVNGPNPCTTEPSPPSPHRSRTRV
jgi:hypothetical protein